MRVAPSSDTLDKASAGASTQQQQDGNNGSSGQPNVFARAWNAYERGLNKVVSKAMSANYKLGAWTTEWPVTLIMVSLVVTICICLGWLRFHQETEADVLWVPQTGKARDDKVYEESYYPRTREGASFYAQLQPRYWNSYGGNNALQIPVTWEMFQLHNAVMALTVNGPQGTPVTFANLCARTRAGGCSRGGYLNFWSYNFNTFITSINGSATDPTAGNQDTYRSQVRMLGTR